jgi:hypothetical protein
MGKGVVMHEYVVGMRIVMAAPPGSTKGGLPIFRELHAHDPDLNASQGVPER